LGIPGGWQLCNLWHYLVLHLTGAVTYKIRGDDEIVCDSQERYETGINVFQFAQMPLSASKCLEPGNSAVWLRQLIEYKNGAAILKRAALLRPTVEDSLKTFIGHYHSLSDQLVLEEDRQAVVAIREYAKHCILSRNLSLSGNDPLTTGFGPLILPFEYFGEVLVSDSYWRVDFADRNHSEVCYLCLDASEEELAISTFNHIAQAETLEELISEPIPSCKILDIMVSCNQLYKGKTRRELARFQKVGKRTTDMLFEHLARRDIQRPIELFMFGEPRLTLLLDVDIERTGSFELPQVDDSVFACLKLDLLIKVSD
jgi:hypothetical protein